jgi:hypothetical protein
LRAAAQPHHHPPGPNRTQVIIGKVESVRDYPGWAWVTIRLKDIAEGAETAHKVVDGYPRRSRCSCNRRPPKTRATSGLGHGCRGTARHHRRPFRRRGRKWTAAAARSRLDVLGGKFAVNGGGLQADPGEVCYWGPDTLSWTGIGGGHSALVRWALSNARTRFYSSMRWPGWESERAAVEPDRGLSLYPPPFTTEGPDVSRARCAPVPITELHAFYADIRRQFADRPDGFTFRFTTDD